jgi:hypothetical protein
VVLRATDQGTVGVSTAALPVTEDEAADLEHYIDVSRAEVLFATAVILTELYVLPAFAAAASFDLDTLQAAFTPAVSRPPWAGMLYGLSRPSTGLSFRSPIAPSLPRSVTVPPTGRRSGASCH